MQPVNTITYMLTYMTWCSKRRIPESRSALCPLSDWGIPWASGPLPTRTNCHVKGPSSVVASESRVLAIAGHDAPQSTPCCLSVVYYAFVTLPQHTSLTLVHGLKFFNFLSVAVSQPVYFGVRHGTSPGPVVMRNASPTDIDNWGLGCSPITPADAKLGF